MVVPLADPLRVMLTPDIAEPFAALAVPEIENPDPLIKLAVTVFAEFIVNVAGLPVLLIEPLQEPKV